MFITKPDRPDRIKVGEAADTYEVHTVPHREHPAQFLVGGADRKDRAEPMPVPARIS